MCETFAKTCYIPGITARIMVGWGQHQPWTCCGLEQGAGTQLNQEFCMFYRFHETSIATTFFSVLLSAETLKTDMMMMMMMIMMFGCLLSSSGYLTRLPGWFPHLQDNPDLAVLPHDRFWAWTWLKRPRARVKPRKVWFPENAQKFHLSFFSRVLLILNFCTWTKACFFGLES